MVLVAQSVLALETRPTCRGKNFIRFASFDVDNNSEIFTYRGRIKIETGRGSKLGSGHLLMRTSDSPAGGTSGNVDVQSGTSFYGGSGSVIIQTGTSYSGKAGNVKIAVGSSASGSGGYVSISAG